MTKIKTFKIEPAFDDVENLYNYLVKNIFQNMASNGVALF